MYAHLRLLVISVLSLIPVAAAPQATPPAGVPGPDETWQMPNRDAMNANTVTIITAPAGGASAMFGSDIMRVLDDGVLRVIPVLGKGPVRNTVDILYLKSIDMGLVAGDVPEFYKLQYKIPDVASRLRYIAKLYNNELHIIAPTNIKSIFDLEGKRISAQTDVGYYSAKVIFARLGIRAQFDYWTDDARAIQKVIDGESDAYITSTGKVFPLARAIKNEDRRLHLVPIPFDPRLLDLYLPATLSGSEYPNLLEPNETINIKIPGWERFKAADDWIAQHVSTNKTDRESFERFLSTNHHPEIDTPEKKAALFRQFLEWQKTPRSSR